MIPVDKLAAIPTDKLRELNSAIVEEIRRRRAMESRVNVRNFTKGDLVKWQDKDKTWSQGVVEEIKRTRVHVRQTIGVPVPKLWAIRAGALSFVTPD